MGGVTGADGVEREAGRKGRAAGRMTARSSDLRRRLAAADASVRNAWLLIAVLLMSLACVGETLSRLMVDGLSSGVIAAWLSFAAVTACMAFRPIVGCMATTTLWMTLCLGGAPMPSAAMPAMLLALGVAGYAGGRLCVVPLAAVALTWACLGIRGGAAAGRVLFGVVTIRGTGPMVALSVGAVLCGVAVRWNHDRDLARAELETRRRRESAARGIHDYVANDLSYLVLRLDRDIADGVPASTDELCGLRDVAAEALVRTRHVIDVVEGRGGPDDSGSGRFIGGTCRERPGRLDGFGRSGMDAVHGDSCPLAGQLRAVVREGDRRLEALGFHGQTVFSCAGMTGMVGIDEDDDIADLLRELYGNIAKHADPKLGYVMTVRIDDDATRIVCVDEPHHSDAGGAAHDGTPDDETGRGGVRHGTGLDRHRGILEQRNGSLRVETQGPEWVVRAVAPHRRSPDSIQ